GKAVVRAGGRRILLVGGEKGVFACVERCPHQGYPLSEGTLSEGSVLTCNWHNWKFDLSCGATLVGGDRVRRFPVRVADDRVLLDLAPEDACARREAALAGLLGAMEEEDQERIVREAASLEKVAPFGETLLAVLAWAAPRFEFGTTHAIAAAPDWMSFAEAKESEPDERLAAMGEVLGNIAEDVRGRGAAFPLPSSTLPWSEKAFLAAVEAENEFEAVSLLNGALVDGAAADELAPALVRAALLHYADFGHSLIYTLQSLELVERLGPASATILLPMLVRSVVFARREDLLPEFRDYPKRLADWGEAVGPAPRFVQSGLRRRSAKSAMAIVGAWSSRHASENIFDILVSEAAWQLLHANELLFTRTEGAIADNVGWLDFTHALTFADAGLKAARISPSVWPAVLLQLGCFIGRNSGFVDPDLDASDHLAAVSPEFGAAVRSRLFDHGEVGFIVPAHFAKTLAAAERLASARPQLAKMVLAAAHRFLFARIKRRHVLRTARQMRDFVAAE
ncbi:MAG: Rieske (2Fe-2S) protein, partial [Caulobacteraceae bacterium]